MSEKIYTIDEIKSLLNEIFYNFNIKKAILFGSYAKQTPTSKSDIDIVVDSDGKLLNINFYGLLEEIVQKLQKNIDLFEITEIQKIVIYIIIYKRRELLFMKSKDRIIIQKLLFI